MPNSTQNVNVVILDHVGSEPRLRYITLQEFQNFSLKKQQYQTRKVVQYLQTFQEIPIDAFRNPDGSIITCLTEEKLNQTLSLIYHNLDPSYAIRLAPRTPTEVHISWMSALEQELGKLTAVRTSDSILLSQITRQKEQVTVLLNAQKSRWMKHELTITAVKASLKSDSDSLRIVGLNELADFAYRSDVGDSLYRQLPVSNEFAPIAARLHDNIYGAAFETFWMSYLIESPPEGLLSTMAEIGKGINYLFQGLSSQEKRTFMAGIKARLAKDLRPWHDHVPKLKSFIQLDTLEQEIPQFQLLLQKPTNGYEAISIVSLAQHTYVAYINTFKKYGKKLPSWALATQVNSPLIKNLQKTSNDERSPSIHTPVFPRPGLTMWHQPSTGDFLGDGPLHRPVTSYIPKLDPFGSMVRTSLENGLPYIKGVSGTTNLFLGMVAHFNVDRKMSIDVPNALLALNMFTTYDGGHSLHEVLWLVTQRKAMAEQLMDDFKLDHSASLLHPRTRYLNDGLDVVFPNQQIDLETFVSNYELFVKLYENSPEINTSLTHAYNAAWEKTLNYFSQNSYYANDYAMKTIINHLQQHPDSDITRYLGKLLSDGQSSAGQLELRIVRRLKNIVENTTFNSQEIKNSTLNILEGIIQAEEVMPKLLRTMKKHSTFAHLSRKDVWRLMIDRWQQKFRGPYGFEKMESGYLKGMIEAFKYMLETKDEKLTAHHLLSLHDKTIDGVLKDSKVLYNFNNLSSQLKQTLRDDFFINKGYRNNTTVGYEFLVKSSDILEGNQNATWAGIDELIKKSLKDGGRNFIVEIYKRNQDGSPVPNKNGIIGRLVAFKKTAEECEARAKELIDSYYAEIASAQTPEEKLTVIARFCRNLESEHLFSDGNARLGVIILDKLLLQNGFDPTILINPNITDGFSVSELVEEIKKGQRVFKSYSAPPSNQNLKPQINSGPEGSLKLFNNVFGDHLMDVYQDKYLNLEGKLLDEKNPDFLTGRQDTIYKSVEIAGYIDKMSLLEKYVLAVEGNLDLKQLGALTRHIEATIYRHKRIITEELGKNEAILKKYFHSTAHQPIYKNFASQRLLLASDHYSKGLCFALTWATAIALAEGGQASSDLLANRIVTAGESPQSRHATILKGVLNIMNQYAHQRYAKRSAEEKQASQYSLTEIFTQLSQAASTQMYELGTPNHVMMIGVKVDGANRTYFFYDPESLMIGFKELGSLRINLPKYLNDGRLAKYGLFADQNDTSGVHRFEFVRIDTTDLANKRILVAPDVYLTPKMLSQEESLITIIGNQQRLKKERTVSLNQFTEQASHDTQLYLSISVLEQEQLAKGFMEAAQKLYTENQLDYKLVPLLESVTENSDTKTYQISFFDPNNPDHVQTVTTRDSFFIRVKRSLKKIVFENTGKLSFPQKTAAKAPRLYPGTGLSIFFAVKVWSASAPQFELSRLRTLSESLTEAIWLQNCFNIFGLGIGTIQDVIAISQWIGSSIPAKSLFVQSYFNSYVKAAEEIGLDIAPLKNVLSRLSPYTSKLARKPLQLVGLVLKAAPVVDTIMNASSVAFDVYQVANAENAHQQKIFITKLAFSSVSLGLSIGGTVAAFAGASTIATPLFVLTIPVGVSGNGIVEVMEFYDNIKQLVEHRVVKYFDEVAEAYRKGFEYDANHEILSIPTGAVVKSIDLQNGQMVFDSQYICRRDPDQPRRVSNDNSTAINFRSTIGGNEFATLSTQAQKARTIVLPNTPKSYVSYDTANIWGISQYDGDAYKTIRLLENNSNYKFKLEHINYALDSIIYKLFHQYQITEVEIKLDHANRILIVPELPQDTAVLLNKESTVLRVDRVESLDHERNNNHKLKSISNAIHYNMTGQGGHYTIFLNERATITLSTSTAAQKPSHWVFNTSQLEPDKDDLVVYPDKVLIGGVSVYIDPINTADQLTIIKQNGDICSIDRNTGKLKLLQASSKNWENNYSTLYDKYEMATHVIIKDYIHQGVNAGNAFYDTQRKQILFTNTTERHQPTELIEILKVLLASPLFIIKSCTYWRLYMKYGNVPHMKKEFKDAYTLEEQNKTFITSLESLIKRWEDHAHISVASGEDALYRKAKQWLEYRSSVITKLEDALYRKAKQWLEYHSGVITKLKDTVEGKSEYTSSEQRLNKWVKSHQSSIPLSNKLQEHEYHFATDLLNKLMDLNQEANQVGLLQNAQLIGNIENLVYWYNLNEGLIWTTDAVSGQVQSQYILNLRDVKRDGIRVWQANNQLYATLDYTDDTNKRGEATYLIADDRMELISLRASGTDLDVLSQSKEDALLKYKSSSAADFSSKGFQFADVKTIKTTIPKLVTVYDRNSTDTPFRCWIYYDPNGTTLIKPDIPNMSIDMVDSLMLVAIMSLTPGHEVFLFLDPSQKALYYQKGTGPNILNSTQHRAARLTGSFLNVQTIAQNVLAVTEEGFVMEVDIEGQLVLVALNEQWLKKQGTNWRSELANINMYGFITILGLKDTDKTNLLVWYDGEKLIMAPQLKSDSIELLHADEEYALLFDSKSKKLYKQAIISDEQLNNAFSSDCVLSERAEIEAAKELFPAQEFMSAYKKIPGLIYLETVDGVTLYLDHTEKAHMVSLNQMWQNQHSGNLSQAIDLLTQKWSYGESVILQNDLNSSPTWYHFKLRRKITAPNLSGHDQAELIGTTLNDENQISDIYINSSKGLYKYSMNQSSNKYYRLDGTAQRFDTTLLLQGTDNDDILGALPLENSTSNTMSAKEGNDVYIINKQAREKLKRIIIDNFAKDKKKDVLQLYISSTDETLVFKKENDLLIADQNGIVEIRKVFGEEKAEYSHLKIITTDNRNITRENQVVDWTSKITRLSSYTDSQQWFYLSSLDQTYAGDIFPANLSNT